MNINPLSSNLAEILSSDVLSAGISGGTGALTDSFANVLTEAISAALETNRGNSMFSDPLSANIANLLSNDQIAFARPGITGANTGSYTDIVSEALNTASAADSADKRSSLALLAGQTDDLSGLLLDAQKAEISLNLALQIRNKIIDAYNEILRMQV